MACEEEDDSHKSCNRWYFNAEYLIYWIKGTSLPPLVTTGQPLVGGGADGALGRSDTLVLFGNSNQGNQSRSGARFQLGWWFDDDHSCGLEGIVFFLGRNDINFRTSSSPSGVLALPFYDSAAGGERAFALASPLVPSHGAVAATLTNRLWGSEINLRRSCYDGDIFKLDGIVGFRSLSLREDLSIDSSTTVEGSSNMTVYSDRFKTTNDFYGGQIGALMDFQWGDWNLGIKTKLALGCTSQQVDVFGITSGNVPGGFYAGPNAAGRHQRNRFSFVPELGAQVGYQITDWMRCYFGYDLLHWTNVALPGNEIDRVRGGQRPVFVFRDNSFWAQGVSLGLEFKW
jgi:hypothetical protein